MKTLSFQGPKDMSFRTKEKPQRVREGHLRVREGHLRVREGHLRVREGRIPYSKTNFLVLNPFFCINVFLHISQVNFKFVFFDNFAPVLLNFEIAGLLPHFPLLPIPTPNPLFLALWIEPCFKAPLSLLLTSPTLCSVYFLQYLQYLLTFFGYFIFFCLNFF